VRLVVADTGPLNYLVLIGAIEVLPKLFETIFVPSAVFNELTDADSPLPVRAFAADKPPWLDVRPNPSLDIPELTGAPLDDGERAAIGLAKSIAADLILMDDRAGVVVARRLGFSVTGTLGILDLAATRGLIELADAFARLKSTNFRYPPAVMDSLLARRRKDET
jgi:predicted nucleic acid-binding protein